MRLASGLQQELELGGAHFCAVSAFSLGVGAFRLGIGAGFLCVGFLC